MDQPIVSGTKLTRLAYINIMSYLFAEMFEIYTRYYVWSLGSW